MSVLIRGMEMPKPGQIVLVEIDENGDVFAAYDGGKTKLTQHKAVPVPPHGDLIDKQYAYQNTMVMGEHIRKIILKQIDLLPTVIPAEEGET